jgi:Kef-type K+ transport system membrane component KefB
MFSILMFVIGIIITVYAFKIANDVTTCNTNSQNSVRGLLVMGVALVSICATTLICGCSSNKTHPLLGTAFISLMFIISLTTTVLTYNIQSDCQAAKNDTSAIFILAIIGTVFSGGFLGLKLYNYKETGGKSDNSHEMKSLSFSQLQFNDSNSPQYGPLLTSG